ncbi:dihydropteroate synthase [bacterium]|nr:dihydropteroate synthase [bacterium]
MNIDSFKTWLGDDNRKSLIMGILNVTPDSFSDGGQYNNTQKAIDYALKMEDEGADLIDIGGESTRPGAKQVDIEEELNRVIPVINGIRKNSNIVISIDTYKSSVADKAIKTGANIINDISGLRFDNDMVRLASELQVPVIVMHMLGNPQNMQNYPIYNNLVEEIILFFKERVDLMTSNGILKNNIILDPGIGFGKTVDHNFTIIRELSSIVDLGFPVLVGPSRKSFIGHTLNLPPGERIEGTAAAVTAAIMHGSRIVRVHDVKEMSRVVKVTEQICGIT